MANSKVISNTLIGDFISSYETPLYPPIENFPKAELRRREKIKNKFEKSYNSTIETNNNLKILNQKFDELQSFQESELLKNKMGVENIVKEEVNEQIYDDEFNVSRDEEELVNHIYEKVKQSHLKKNEKYKIINEELKIDKKNKDIAEGEFKELYRLNLRSYERFLKNKSPNNEINQKISTTNVIQDIGYLIQLNEKNKEQFVRLNNEIKKRKPSERRIRKSIFDLV